MTELLKLGVMASGGGTNLQSIIDACQSGKCPAEVVVVLSDREEAFALERARRYGIPAVHIPVGKTGSQAWEEAERQQVEALRDHGVQLVCLAGYMRINGPILLSAFQRAVLNIHPALLPAFPGVHVQAKAADHGVKIAGTTVHFADPEFDTGPIIIQAAVPAFEGDNSDSLGSRILEQEHRIYPQAIKWFAEGRLQIEGRKVRVLDLNLDDPKLIYGTGGKVLINPPLDTDF